jgi:hypothetical protein
MSSLIFVIPEGGVVGFFSFAPATADDEDSLLLLIFKLLLSSLLLLSRFRVTLLLLL